MTKLHETGFSLIELMITLAIIGITLAFGLPNLSQIIKNNRMTSQINALSGSLSLARSEAVKRGEFPVILCGSSTGASCNTTALEKGWIVFVDENEDGAFASSSDKLLRIHEALNDSLTLRLSGFSSATSVIFDTRGSLTQAGTATLCDDRGNKHARAIILNISGQTRVGLDSNTDEIIENHAGDNVAC